jgi:hypothetical protein
VNLVTLNARAGRISFVTGPVLYFAADQELYVQGGTADMFLKLIAGAVRTCRFLNDGRRQIDAFYLPGDIFGFEFAAAPITTACRSGCLPTPCATWPAPSPMPGCSGFRVRSKNWRPSSSNGLKLRTTTH